MIATWRKGRALAEMWIAHMSAYRAEIVIWIMTGMLPLMMMAIWISKAQQQGGTTNGFRASDFATYFLAAWLSQQLIVAWVAWELDRQIRLGELSAKLLRPLDVFWEHLAAHLAERVVRTPFTLLIVACGVLLIPGVRLTPDIWHALLYLVAILLGFLIRFLIAYCIGILTFWFDRATAIDELYYVIATFLTGGFAPLELYPPAVRTVIDWLPFPYTIYYPVQVLIGRASLGEIGRIIAVQATWLLGLWLLRSWLWRRGLARYGAVGA